MINVAIINHINENEGEIINYAKINNIDELQDNFIEDVEMITDIPTQFGFSTKIIINKTTKNIRFEFVPKPIALEEKVDLLGQLVTTLLLRG